MRRTGKASLAAQGVGTATAAAEDQAGEQALGPVRAVEAVCAVMLAHGGNDIGVFVGQLGLLRLRRLPELIGHDAQFGNLSDDPFRFRVEP
ncbi:hypothetical protein L598_000700000190 [Mesorhizobium sp. J18]|nr:hypothetical protein L598_000700000190 [Mesorhizobium sp. J18]